AGDFVRAGVGGECGGVGFDQDVLDRAVIWPAVFFGNGAEDLFGEFTAAVGVGHDCEALAGVGVGFDVAAEGRGDFRRAILRERLLVGAVGHARGAENEFAHDLREGLSRDVGQKRLKDYVAAAGIAPESARYDVDAYGIGIGGFFAVKDLHDGGNGFVGGVTGETVNRKSSAVAEDTADGDFFFYGEGVFRDFPSAEFDVDVFVETELAFLHEAKRGEGGDGFAGGSGLEKRIGCDWFLGRDIGEAIGFGPDDLAVVKEGHADAGNFVVRHALVDGHRLGRLAFDDDGREKAVFDAGDDGGK